MPRMLLRFALAACLLALPATAQETTEEVEAAPVQPPAGPSALQRAYQKEVAFLLSERAALQERLRAAEADGQGRIDGARAEVDRLQGRLLSLQREADDAEQILDDADDGSRKALESSDLVGSTLQQASTSLVDFGVTIEAAPGEATVEENARNLGQAFSSMVGLIGDGGAVRTEDGSFFLADGTQTTGKLVRVGRVATYGVADAGSGALAPAGQGRMRLTNNGGADVAKALQRGGTTPGITGIFLHESVAQAFEEREGRTLADVIDAGGPVGLVILALGAIAMLLVLVRAWSLLGLGRSAAAVLDAIEAPLRAGDLGAAEAAAKGVGGAGAAVAVTVLGARTQPHETLEDVASEALLGAEPKLQRFGTPISVIAAVAPLLGLLGTVTGMIATFEIITNVGTGNPKLLSGGISEALVTTQLGLIVAIPALLLGNLLGARAERVRGQLEQSALAVLNAVGLQVATLRQAEVQADSGALVIPPRNGVAPHEVANA